MALQKFPTGDDVRALIRHQYPPNEQESVSSLLDSVTHAGHMGWTPEKIHLAALAMSNGNKSLIPQWIELGNLDCRDLQVSVHGHLGPNWDRDCLLNVER